MGGLDKSKIEWKSCSYEIGALGQKSRVVDSTVKNVSDVCPHQSFKSHAVTSNKTLVRKEGLGWMVVIVFCSLSLIHPSLEQMEETKHTHTYTHTHTQEANGIGQGSFNSITTHKAKKEDKGRCIAR